MVRIHEEFVSRRGGFVADNMEAANGIGKRILSFSTGKNAVTASIQHESI